MTAEEPPSPQPESGTRPLDVRRLSLLWALQGHAGDVSRMHGTMFESAWDEAAVGGLLAHPGSIALVACQGAPPEFGGFALAQIAADEAEILSVGVVEGWRRHGVANRLLAAIKRAAIKGGARALFLEVAESNVAARALYGQAGFVESGRRKGYYAHAGAKPEDAVVLRAELEA